MSHDRPGRYAAAAKGLRFLRHHAALFGDLLCAGAGQVWALLCEGTDAAALAKHTHAARVAVLVQFSTGASSQARTLGSSGGTDGLATMEPARTLLTLTQLLLTELDNCSERKLASLVETADKLTAVAPGKLISYFDAHANLKAIRRDRSAKSTGRGAANRAFDRLAHCGALAAAASRPCLPVQRRRGFARGRRGRGRGQRAAGLVACGLPARRRRRAKRRRAERAGSLARWPLPRRGCGLEAAREVDGRPGLRVHHDLRPPATLQLPLAAPRFAYGMEHLLAF